MTKLNIFDIFNEDKVVKHLFDQYSEFEYYKMIEFLYKYRGVNRLKGYIYTKDHFKGTYVEKYNNFFNLPYLNKIDNPFQDLTFVWFNEIKPLVESNPREIHIVILHTPSLIKIIHKELKRLNSYIIKIIGVDFIIIDTDVILSFSFESNVEFINILKKFFLINIGLMNSLYNEHISNGDIYDFLMKHGLNLYTSFYDYWTVLAINLQEGPLCINKGYNYSEGAEIFLKEDLFDILKKNAPLFNFWNPNHKPGNKWNKIGRLWFNPGHNQALLPHIKNIPPHWHWFIDNKTVIITEDEIKW